MSIHEIDLGIHDLQLKDSLVQAPGFCRYAAEAMIKTAVSSDKTSPHEKVEILVYPDAVPDEYVHYAIKAGNMIFNSVQASGFPIYFGPSDSAPGLLTAMKTTETII